MNMRDYVVSGTDADGVKRTVSVRAESGADAVNDGIERALTLQVSMEHVRSVQGALS